MEGASGLLLNLIETIVILSLLPPEFFPLPLICEFRFTGLFEGEFLSLEHCLGLMTATSRPVVLPGLEVAAFARI